MGAKLFTAITAQVPAKATASVDGSDGLVLWAARINSSSQQQPLLDTSADSAVLQQRLTPAEREKVRRYMRVPDQQRALLSILLQRSMVAHCFPALRTDDYELPRTREGKPFLRLSDEKQQQEQVGTWNFNVSHHGDFVCIASHPQLLLGADIVDVSSTATGNRRCSPREYFEMFRQQLTQRELNAIMSPAEERDQYTMFFLHWALKEAFIKAVGQGLGFDLQRVNFVLKLGTSTAATTPITSTTAIIDVATTTSDVSTDATSVAAYDLGAMQRAGSITATASVQIDGVERDDWRFDLVSLDSNHVLALARGPLTAALDSFRAAAGWSTATTTTPTTHIITATTTAAAAVATVAVEQRKQHLALLQEPLPAVLVKSFEDLLKF